MSGPIVMLPVGAKGVDYLHPAVNHTPQWMVENGYSFACRYVARTSRIGKIVTSAEVHQLHAAGIAVLLTYEGSANDVFGGAQAGAANGVFAKSFAQKLGYPLGLPVFAAADTDVTSSNLGQAVAYMRAFHDAVQPYTLGIYGDTLLLAALADLSPVGWEPQARSWSPKEPTGTVHIQQQALNKEASVDANLVLVSVPAWLVQ